MMSRCFWIVSFLLITFTAQAQWHQITGGPYGGGVHAFVEIANTNGQRLYAASPNGVYRSTNKAQTWSAAGLQGKEITHLIQFTTSQPQEILFASTDSELYRSLDSAKSWSRVFTTVAPGQTFIRNIRQTGNDLYIGVAYFTYDTARAGIYHSTDFGSSWTKLIAPATFGEMTDLTTSGKYIIVATIADGIWRQQTGTTVWTQTNYPKYRIPNAFVNYGTDVLVGATGGIWLTTNDGADWIKQPSIGLDTTIPFSSFAIDSDTIVASGARGIYKTIDNGRTWSRIDGKGGYPRDFTTYNISNLSGQWLAGAVAGVLASNDGTNWRYQSDSILAANVLDIASNVSTIFALTSRGIWHTDDHGLTWHAPNDGNDLQDSLAAGFNTTSDGSLFAVGNGLWRWNGSKWSSLNELNVTSIAGDGVTLYAAAGLRGAIRSTNAGRNWTDISEGLPIDTGRTTIVFTDSGKLFAVAQNYPEVRNEVYLSTNGGNSWTYQDALAVSDPINSFAHADYGLLLGSSNGLFISNDGGHRWELDPLPKPNLRFAFLRQYGSQLLAGIEGTSNLPGGLYSLAIDNYQLLSAGVPEIVQGFAADNVQGYLATSSSGVWAESELKGVKQHDATEAITLRIYPNPMKDRGLLSFALPEREHIAIRIFDVSGREQATIFEGTLDAGEHQLPILAPQIVNGAYEVVLETEASIASTHFVLTR